jgi:uncharacterized Tic20 family protein
MGLLYLYGCDWTELAYNRTEYRGLATAMLNKGLKHYRVNIEIHYILSTDIYSPDSFAFQGYAFYLCLVWLQQYNVTLITLFLTLVLFYVLFVLCCSMYCLFCVVLCIVRVYMCTVLLPPGGYPIAIKYIISFPVLFPQL